jgi:hypothetical protein
MCSSALIMLLLLVLMLMTTERKPVLEETAKLRQSRGQAEE